MILLLIGLGGGLGSIARYLLGGAVQRSSHAGFPMGTLVVNVIGCVAVGLLWRAFMGDPREQQLRAALVIGFCGGFTTFSAFSLETVGLIQGGEWGKASLYVITSVGAGLLGTAIALFRSPAAH
jgi:CrcB protein